MTSAEIARELHAVRPVAPAPLRARVLADARREPVRAPSLLERVRRQRLLVLVPAAASLAVAAAVVIGVTRPGDAREAAPTTSTEALTAELAPGGTPADAVTAAPSPSTPSAKTGAVDDRAQRITAALTLRVADGEALSTATRDAIRITRSLDGYVVRSDVAAGDDGFASLSLRVPSANAQDAIARLSALGTIVAQRVQADDLQAGLDALQTELTRRRAALAAVQARLASEDLTSVERAVLQSRRTALVAEIATLRAQQTATRAEAAEATIDVELRTDSSAGVVPVPSRLDRTLTRALDVLAWEAVALLGLVIVLAPLALFGLALWGVRRTSERRSTERLLAAP
jgi:Domain of unknown function (DUF4349)